MYLFPSITRRNGFSFNNSLNYFSFSMGTPSVELKCREPENRIILFYTRVTNILLTNHGTYLYFLVTFFFRIFLFTYRNQHNQHAYYLVMLESLQEVFLFVPLNVCAIRRKKRFNLNVIIHVFVGVFFCPTGQLMPNSFSAEDRWCNFHDL
jgi:hypothetical protein